MLFAYLHPSFEAALQRIDKMSTKARLFIRTVITAGQSSWHVADAGNSPDADKDLDSCFVGWMQYGTSSIACFAQHLPALSLGDTSESVLACRLARVWFNCYIHMMYSAQCSHTAHPGQIAVAQCQPV